MQTVNDQLYVMYDKINQYGYEKMGITDLEQRDIVESRSVSCDGGIGSSGHPNVYLKIGNENKVICPYCSRVFILNIDVNDGVKL